MDDFNDNEVFGMAHIRYYPIGTKSVEVYVHTDDPGKVPHFHVMKRGSWETCIKFESAEYFLHGSYKKKLPKRSLVKDMDKMLRKEKVILGIRTTYWKFAISMWNENNSDIQLSEDPEQPDYTKLDTKRL